jgi:hypothetical protein
VLRLRQQIVEDQDHYRKCRDMMAEKLQNYNDKFNLQEEAIQYLDEQLNMKTPVNAENGKLECKEIARVPQFPAQKAGSMAAFNPKHLF